MDALGWARAFDDSDAEGESEGDESDADVFVVAERGGAVDDDVGGGVGSRAAPTRERHDGENDARLDADGRRDGGATSTTTVDARDGASMDGASVASGVRVGRVGPELRELRAAQGESREYYTMEHYNRLYGAETAWRRTSRGSKTWCKDVHGPGCRECTSCHFCRQKTTDAKTTCQCGFWSRAPAGGRGRGVWCGWCLEMRMGENLEEAQADSEWRCPVCRDICNCSGANCLRAQRNLFPTQQLTAEALNYGWPSVAHYLITTAIVSGKDAPPMLDLPAAFTERRRRQRDPNASREGSGGRGTIPGMFGAQAQKEARAVALRAKVAANVRAAFGDLAGRDDDADDEGGGDDEAARASAGANRVEGARAPRSSRGRERSRARRARGLTDDNDSSDGSELDSSDGESDVEAPVPSAIPRAGDAVYLRDEEARATSAETVGQARARDSDGAHHTKQKRARTNYGVSARERSDGEWRSDDDAVEVDAPARQWSVAEIACDDDRGTSGSVARAPARPRTVTTTTEYGETVVLQEGETEAPTRRRRRRRRRVPRPGTDEEFTTVNPDVIEAAQSRAVHASAQEEDEESRAAQGEGPCAAILREMRGDAKDEHAIRDALVRSNEALRTAMVLTDAQITVDESELRAFCSLVVRIARVGPKTPLGLQVISDARETLADAETFSLHSSTGRAVVLRALIRCTDHAAYQNVHVRESLIQLLTLMATLGQEYCLIRDNVQSKQGEAVSPLPPHIQAAIDEIHVNDAENEVTTTLKEDEVAMLLLERLEAAHVLLYATMAALRRSIRGPPLAGREELFCPTLAAFIDPAFAFKAKLRKQALRLIAAGVTAATRDWGNPKSPEIVALATNASEYIWPKLSDLLAVDIPGRASSMGEDAVRLGASGVTRAVIEGSARLIGLLLRSGVWAWGQAETAILAPHTAATFWRVAMAPQRALAMRLYSRLIDISPIYYGGIGAPLLKLWARATMDPAAGESATGMNRARARIARAAKRHPVLFAAFPNSLSLEGCDSPEPVSIERRARWVAEVIHQAATTAVSPRARLSAVAACNALFEVSCWNQSLALTSGSSTRSAYLAANALVFSTAASRLHAALLTPPPPKLFRVVQHVLEMCAQKSARESPTRPETLSNTALAIASQFDATDPSTITALVAVLHEAFERPHASDAEAVVAAVWAALDADDSLHQSVGIPSEKLIATKRFIITACAKRAIERSRYVTASRSGTHAVEGWALALRALAETSASVDWLDELAPSILDAMQPPAVAIGKAAAPPPISTSHPMIRTRLYDLLASAVTRHPRLAETVDGDEGDERADERSVFFIAVSRAAIGEIAYFLGGADDCKGYAPLREADRNAAGRRLRSVSRAAAGPSRVVEEVYRSYKPPKETIDVSNAADVDVSMLTGAAIAALRFISAFASATPAARRMVKTYVLSPIKAAMRRKESRERRALVAHVNDLWAKVGLIQSDDKENAAPSVPSSSTGTRSFPTRPWPAGAAEPNAFASVAKKPDGSTVNVVGQLIKRAPAKGVDVKENPKTGKRFDMLFVTLGDHAGDEMRVQLIGASAKACARALDAPDVPSDVALGFIGLKTKGATVWDPKETAELVLNPSF